CRQPAHLNGDAAHTAETAVAQQKSLCHGCVSRVFLAEALMLDLTQLLTAHPFPTALDLVRRSFARQPDDQTCGAAAIRHGLLLGGLSAPTAILEAVLDIRGNQGTSPRVLRACLRRFGLDARPIRKPARQATAAFLDGLREELDRGAFLLPCIHAGEHWVCLGAWQDGRIGLVDS